MFHTKNWYSEAKMDAEQYSGSGDILFFSGHPSVRLSVCHKLCPLYNLKTA